MKNIVIAIDGFSSSGKSSMARQLAKTIGYRYIDSGAMYRAVTLYALQHSMIDPTGNVDKDRLVQSLNDIRIDFYTGSEGQRTLLNGVDVENEIRGMEVSDNVSPVAAIAEVRHDMVRKQQAFGAGKGIVMDGRDIGTTVFPDAELKIFVNASALKRAERRFKELSEKGIQTTMSEVMDNVLSRDSIDMNRKESPLRRAEDAIDLDNSEMTIDQQNKWLLDQYIRVAQCES